MSVNTWLRMLRKLGLFNPVFTPAAAFSVYEAVTGEQVRLAASRRGGRGRLQQRALVLASFRELQLKLRPTCLILMSTAEPMY